MSPFLINRDEDMKTVSIGMRPVGNYRYIAAIGTFDHLLVLVTFDNMVFYRVGVLMKRLPRRHLWTPPTNLNLQPLITN